MATKPTYTFVSVRCVESWQISVVCDVSGILNFFTLRCQFCQMWAQSLNVLNEQIISAVDVNESFWTVKCEALLFGHFLCETWMNGLCLCVCVLSFGFFSFAVWWERSFTPSFRHVFDLSLSLSISHHLLSVTSAWKMEREDIKEVDLFEKPSW